MKHLIAYNSKSTVNGKPVGDVYVQACPWISPGVHSYTKDPDEATAYGSRAEAESVVTKHSWPAPWLVPANEAKPLT